MYISRCDQRASIRFLSFSVYPPAAPLSFPIPVQRIKGSLDIDGAVILAARLYIYI